MRQPLPLLLFAFGAVLIAALPVPAAEDLRPRAKPTAPASWDPLVGPFAIRRDPVTEGRTFGPLSGLAEPLPQVRPGERAPQPGDWTASVDPDFDLAPRAASSESERNRLSELLTPLRLQTIRVEVTRHF